MKLAKWGIWANRGILLFGLAGMPCNSLSAELKDDAPLLRIENGMHVQATYQPAFDAARKYMVTGSDDKTIRVWEVQTGKLLRVIRPPIGRGTSGVIYAVAMTPDGKTVAGAGQPCQNNSKCRSSIYIFDRVTGTLVKKINGLPESVTRLLYSRDGRILAAATFAGLRIYRTSDYSLIGEDDNYSGYTAAMDFDNNGKLVVGSFDGGLRLYKEKDYRLVGKAEFEGGLLFAAKFSPDGTKIAIGFANHFSLSIRDATQKTLPQLAAPRTLTHGTLTHIHRVRAVEWSSDGHRLYAAEESIFRDNMYQRQWNDPPKKLGGLLYIWEDRHYDDPTGKMQLPIETAMELRSLSDSELLFVSDAGAFGIIDTKGRVRNLKEPSKADFSEASYYGLVAHKKPLLISDDGMTIEFPYTWRLPAQVASFSLAERKIDAHKAENDKFFKPFDTLTKTPYFWDFETLEFIVNGKKVPGGSREEMFVSVAFGHDKGDVLVATNNKLTLYNSSLRSLWSLSTPEAALAINVSGNNKLAIVAFDSGIIRWYRMRDGEELVALFLDMPAGRWIVWTPQGYFDASPGAEEMIGWHVNQGSDKEGQFFPVSQFFHQYYRPDLISEVLRMAETEQEVMARLKDTGRLTVAEGFKLPPRVTILSPLVSDSSADSGIQALKAELEVVVQAEDQGGGVDEIRLYQNDKAVVGDTKGVAVVKDEKPRGATVKRFIARLINGRNVFRAVAFSRDRIESHPVEVAVVYQGEPRPATLHLLLVGINEYKNSVLNLNYALPDAQGLREFFIATKGGLFKQVKEYELYNKAATKAGILQKLQEVQSSNPEDVVVLYLSGHGESVGDVWYFVTHEVTAPEREDVLRSQALSSMVLKEHLDKLKAQKVLVFMDSCKSGSALKAFAGRDIADRRAAVQLARAAGIYIVAASTKEQLATEVKELGHGLFTYSLLQGLKGGADGGANKDGIVTVQELLAYVNMELPKLTEKYKGQPQYPVVNSLGMDFPLATVR